MISIIIPTYNEADNIAALIKQISLNLKGQKYEIIVVDDDSPDRTWQLVIAKSQEDKRIRLIRRINERGLTSAFNRGIEASRGDIIGWLDADLSHPPALLKKMLPYFPRFDVVVASRYVAGGSDRRRERLAVILSRLINRLARFCLDHGLTDYTSGYILVKKSHLKNIYLEGDYGEYFIGLIYHLKQTGVKIKEIGYSNVSRVKGESKTAGDWSGWFRRGVKYLMMVFRLCFKK